MSNQDLGALVKLLSDGGCAPDHPGSGEWVVFTVAGVDTDRRKAIEKLLGRDLPTGSVVRIKDEDWINPEPDYASLVEFLVWLTRVPDGLGETNLSEKEAGRIRALGFRAAAGPWRVPDVPHELVVGGLFESCSDLWRKHNGPGCQPENGFGGSDGEPNATSDPCVIEIELPVSPARKGNQAEEPRWSDDEARVLAALRRHEGYLKRRILQQRLWRMHAAKFNAALESLTQRKILSLDHRHVRIVSDGKGSGDAQLQVELHAR